MKYGIIIHKKTRNIGDDIQTLATSQFLPQIDCFIDREQLHTFEGHEGEPVAAIMAAWYIWAKWNWPPSKYLVPKFVGFHYSDIQRKQVGGPILDEFLTGPGEDYLKAYGPIGCRDYHTLELMQKHGIDSYFSGCITLTTPAMKRTKQKQEYICLVDMRDEVIAKVKKMLEGTGIKVKVMTHKVNYLDSQKTWEERKVIVEDLLTTYCNAKCVLTSRLHCTLPCLGMGVPVLAITFNAKNIRWSPYKDWVHFVTPTEFLEGKCEYSLLNPPPNPTKHLNAKEGLVKAITAFIEESQNYSNNADDLVKTSYTREDIIRWENTTMKQALEVWFPVAREDFHTIRKLEDEVAVAKAAWKQEKPISYYLYKLEKKARKSFRSIKKRK